MLQAVNATVDGDPTDVLTWPQLDPLRPHLLRLIDHAEQAQIDEPTSRLMAQLGTLLSAKALHTQAEPLMRRALAIDERSYPSKHPRVARDLSNLARLLMDTNRLAEAEPLLRRVVEILYYFRQRTAQEHPEMQAAIRNYRALLEALGLSATVI